MTPIIGGDGITPLSPEEQQGLIPTHITCRNELYECEANNIIEADLWAFSRKHKDLLSEEFLLGLHKRMFGGVWSWAGTYRKTVKNLGVKPWCIQPDIRYLLDNARYWIKNGTYESDECAVRFHHRLVAIHPFANGNGRHSRLMSDLAARELGVPRFSWGGGDLVVPGDVRTRYIQALRIADDHDYRPLILFARS